MSEDSGEKNLVSENNILTNIAATKANEELGDDLSSDESKHLLSTPTGTKILSKYEESETNRDNSFKDPMTGLLNRRGIVEEYKLVNRTNARSGSPTRKVGLLGFDLIGLKKLNNELTSGGADIVVKNAAKSLKDQVRETDLVGRWGGDEFVIVLLDADNDTVLKVIQKVNSNLPDHVSYNIGYKVFDSGDPESQINSVMNRMDEIKHLGGVDETGRAIEKGIIVHIGDLKNNV